MTGARFFPAILVALWRLDLRTLGYFIPMTLASALAALRGFCFCDRISMKDMNSAERLT